jgi:DNA-binding response OmpR family regulator
MSLELIQIIEEDQDHARAVDELLRKASFRTNVAQDGQTGVQDIWRLKPALVLMDLILPGMSGKEICARLRSDPQTKSTGIIVLTALGSEDHKVAALESGADDVILKPYHGRELVARVRSVLRRMAAATPAADEEIDDDIALQETQFVVAVRGTRMLLTKAEWTILARLARTSGKVVPREELRAALWGEDGLFHERMLDEAIDSLNAKLSTPSGAGVIAGIHGTGYRLALGAAGEAPLAVRSH